MGGRSEKIVLLSTELAEQFDIPIEHVVPIALPRRPVRSVAPAIASGARHRSAPDRENLAANFRSLSKEKQDFLQGFFDFDDAMLQAAFDALLEKFASR